MTAPSPTASAATETGAGPVLSFIAHGTPVGQGNVRSLGTGRPSVHQNAKTLLPWRDTVQNTAIAATRVFPTAGVLGPQWPLDEPVRVDMTFTVPKPTGAPKTRRVWPSKRPDLDHMVRAVLDSITHVVVVDDARVVELSAAKRYPLEGADALNFPGVVVRVWRIGEGG